MFQAFQIEAVTTRYSVGSKNRQEVGEVLITNFTPVNAGSKMRSKRL